MKITIFGATGSVGRHLVEKSLAQGHQVTAFARNPYALQIEHPNLLLFSGDVLDQRSVSFAIKGAEGVMICLGSAKLTGRLRSDGTRNIINAMEQHGVKRLICQSSLGAGDSRANLNFFWKYLMFGMLLRFVMKDHEIQEAMVRKSKLDWTIIRPAAFIDDANGKGYKHGFAANDRKLTLKIARSDVAEFMLKQINDNIYLRQSPGLSY